MDRNPDWNVFRNIDFCSGVASGASGKGKKTKQEVAGSRTMIRFVLDARRCVTVDDVSLIQCFRFHIKPANKSLK